MTVLADHRHLVESGDRNIYNLSQLPMLQGYNPTHNSNFRYESLYTSPQEMFLFLFSFFSFLNFDLFNEYDFINFPRYRFGDASWTSAYENLLGCPAGRSSTSGGGFYGTVGERFFGSNFSNRANCNFRTGNSTFGDQQSAWRSTHEVKDGLNLQSFHHKHESLQTQPRLSTPTTDHHLQAQVQERSNNVAPDFNKTSNLQEWKTFKRKALDCEQLDLDLSLRLTSRNHEVDSNLSLSLYSQSSSSLTSLKEGPDDAKKQEKRTSTLDLTI